jgi:peptide/nickel transport system ATP-binding protein
LHRLIWRKHIYHKALDIPYTFPLREVFLGQLVETASRDALFAQPRHPYTQALLAAVPTLDPHAEPVAVVQGELPDPSNPPPGCRFSSRCPQANDRCRRDILPCVR